MHVALPAGVSSRCSDFACCLRVRAGLEIDEARASFRGVVEEINVVFMSNAGFVVCLALMFGAIFRDISSANDFFFIFLCSSPSSVVRYRNIFEVCSNPSRACVLT